MESFLCSGSRQGVVYECRNSAAFVKVPAEERTHHSAVHTVEGVEGEKEWRVSQFLVRMTAIDDVLQLLSWTGVDAVRRKSAVQGSNPYIYKNMQQDQNEHLSVST